MALGVLSTKFEQGHVSVPRLGRRSPRLGDVMGAWGYELNQSDAALDVVATAIRVVLEEIEGLVTEGPSRSSALRLAGCLGCVALLDPNDLDPGAALVVDADDFGRSPSGRIRAAMTRHRRALSRLCRRSRPSRASSLRRHLRRCRYGRRMAPSPSR